ncbi:mRNA decay protein [Xanthoria parietina]
MDPKRKRDLRDLNARAWAGEKGVFQVNPTLDSALKKNTAFIKRLRTAISESTAPTFLQEVRLLSLHKYLSEITSASYEGLCKLKNPGEVAAGIEVISALHQRFGPGEYTSFLGWLLGRGMSTPDKAQLKALSQDAREKEEKERLNRHRVLLKVVTELWLVGVLRSLDDIARPEDATAKGKENAASSTSKLGEAVGKSKPGQSLCKSDQGIETEPFPLEILKDLLGNDKEHTNLPLVVLFVKNFGWDILGVRSASAEGPLAPRAKDIQGAATEAGYPSSAEDEAPIMAVTTASYPPLTKPELQQRFRNILERYFVDVKLHIVRDHKNITVQAKRNAEAYVKSGEVFEDRQASHDRQLKAQEKLISNAQVLCDALESQEMPDLRQEDTQVSKGATGIGLVKTEEYLRGQAEGPGIWEDEEERRFYENLVDLQDRVPGVLLEDGKKRKPEEDAQVGKKSEAAAVNGAINGSQDEKVLGISAEDQSTAIANKTVGAQVDALLARLPELQTREAVDQAAMDFCFLNSKASRNRLAKTLQEIPKGRSDLLPIYSRLVATLGKYMPDVPQGLVSYLDEEFRSLQRRKQKDFLGQARTGNVRYLAELTKFGVVPEHVIFHCLKVSLDDFSRMNIDIIGNLLENCGRYLLRNPNTAPRMSSFLETLQRKKAAQHLGQQERMLIENAMYYVNPPERAAIQQKEKSPIQQYISKLVYMDMNKRTYAKILKSIRKLHWEESEVVEILEKIFSKPGKVKFGNINLLAYLVVQLGKLHYDFEVTVVDNLLEQITLGLEQNDFKFNQRRIAEAKYLAELYSYKAFDNSIIFDTLYRIVTFGHANGTPTRGNLNPLDLPDDFFRIRLVCTILDFCGGYFDRGSAKRKLDFFLTFFQYYIATKEPMPMDIDFIVQDSFALTRPQWKLVTGFEEAGQAFANLVKQNYKAQEANKGQAVVQAGAEAGAEAEAEASSSDDDDVENTRVPALDEDAQSSSEEAEPEPMINGEKKHDSDFEDDIVVTRQVEERDPEAEAEFDRELAKMMSESLDSRKFERKALFDVPLPMRRAQRETVPTGDDSGNEGTQTPPNAHTTAFSLMTKKGNRQQTRTIEMPSDSQFAIAMKSQKEAERAEQQRIKNLVLNYDLSDSSAEQAGLGGEKQQPSPHAINAPLQQSPITNGANHAPTNRSGGGRRGQQARKLQLSDVDWT